MRAALKLTAAVVGTVGLVAVLAIFPGLLPSPEPCSSDNGVPTKQRTPTSATADAHAQSQEPVRREEVPQPESVLTSRNSQQVALARIDLSLPKEKRERCHKCDPFREQMRGTFS